MLTVSFIMLTWSTYKFQTCGWKRFHFLFMAVLRMVSKAALAQLTVAKWKWRMCSIDMFDLSDVWQPTGFFKEIITTRGESKIIWIFLFWVFFRNCDKEYQFYICTCWLQQWGELWCPCRVHYTCGRCYAMPTSAGEKLFFHDCKYAFYILLAQ